MVRFSTSPCASINLAMSVDINWETLTSGPDGEALAEKIRVFIHDRFQQIHLPKLIRSVKVRSFEFGKISPEVVLKDICEPLPDFYERDDGDSQSEGNSDDVNGPRPAEKLATAMEKIKTADHKRGQSDLSALEPASGAQLSRGTTPGFLHGTSNLGYFQLPLAGGFSGTNTPLAAVAGARFQAPNGQQHQSQRHADSLSSDSPSSPNTPPSRPVSRDDGLHDHRHSSILHDNDDEQGETPMPTAEHDRSPEDLQVVFRATYSGDIKLAMTAEVFLDYPMPSFVGIPLKLNITGMTFDGVGIMAYIKRKAHVCFLAPEDAEALVGPDVDMDSSDGDTPDHGPSATKDSAHKAHRVGGLIEDIRIESEMGESESGRQVLKNVGKIEKFILEQVQRIFEDEFVYPSFWTFLV